MNVSRYMKRLAREMLEEDPDAFKVRNNNPSDEFAFDLSPSPVIFETSELPENTGAAFVTALDDFGHPVATVPLAETGSLVFLDFAHSALRLPFEQSSVPVSQFVRELCCLIRAAVCQPENTFETFIPAEQILNLRISRLIWDSRLGAWAIRWDDPPADQQEQPLPTSLWRDGLSRLRDSIVFCLAGTLDVVLTLHACERVLDYDYPQMAEETWGGLTQLVYDSSEEDGFLASPERQEHAINVFRAALPFINARLAQLPPDEPLS